MMSSSVGWFSPANEWENGMLNAKIKNNVRERNLMAQGFYTVKLKKTPLGYATNESLRKEVNSGRGLRF